MSGELDGPDRPFEPIEVGRYLLHREIARGGMATIHIARMIGDVGFSRIVAAKRLLPELAEDGAFVNLFLDEARIASKVRHRNVVPVLDVGKIGNEVVLVQEYVHGAPLSWLLRQAHVGEDDHIAVRISTGIACQILSGLQAAHDTVDELGTPLSIVHRDVSPQNIMIATDGTARLLDFGVAKAAVSSHITRVGAFKGKLAYTAPEQLKGEASPKSDVYSLAVVLWELVVGRRMRRGRRGDVDLVEELTKASAPPQLVTDALAKERARISDYRWGQIEAIAPVLAKALSPDPAARYATAARMAEAVSWAVPPAPLAEIAAWLKDVGAEFLASRDRLIAAEEASWRQRNTHSADPATAALTIARAPRKRRWRRGFEIALWCSLIALLGVGVAFLAGQFDAGNAEPAAVAPPPATGSSAPIATTPPPPPAPPVPAPAPATAATTAPPPAPPPAPQHPPKHVAVSSVRAKPHPTQTVHATPKPPPAPPPTAKKNCNPPYYFEGTKKVFKAECL